MSNKRPSPCRGSFPSSNARAHCLPTRQMTLCSPVPQPSSSLCCSLHNSARVLAPPGLFRLTLPVWRNLVSFARGACTFQTVVIILRNLVKRQLLFATYSFNSEIIELILLTSVWWILCNRTCVCLICNVEWLRYIFNSVRLERTVISVDAMKLALGFGGWYLIA